MSGEQLVVNVGNVDPAGAGGGGVAGLTVSDGPYVVNLGGVDPGGDPVPAPPLYATVQAMVARIGESELIQLSDLSGQATGLDAPRIERAIADASAEIDTYLAAKHTLPLPQVPRVLVNVCCDVARYHLAGAHPTDVIKTRYDAATRLLQRLAKGEAQLGLDVMREATPAGGHAPVIDGPPRTFSAASLADY